MLEIRPPFWAEPPEPLSSLCSAARAAKESSVASPAFHSSSRDWAFSSAASYSSWVGVALMLEAGSFPA